MTICIPVNLDSGLQSPVCAHFGSAPLFLIVDTESGECRPIVNGNCNHHHGMCQPLTALAGERFDAIAVGGIGMGALSKLQAANLRVFISTEPTVEKTIAALKSGLLPEATPASACRHGHGHHGHGHGSD